MKLKVFFSISLFFTILNPSAAQTTLSIGDVAFTGYNADNTSPNTEDFSFVILRPAGISSGTAITFTDCGWKSGDCGSDNFRTADAFDLELTWTSSASMAFGDQVKIEGTTASTGTISGNALSLSTGGDQIFAFQGTRASHTMLAGIHMNIQSAGGTTASNWDNTTAPSALQSSRPPCLTNGTYALYISNSGVEVDNAIYNCSSPPSNSQADHLTTINDSTKWTKDDVSSYSLPPSCTFTGPPLPVTWLFFNADQNANKVTLSWATATESNSSRFDIQRAMSSEKNWQTVGHVEAAGNSNKMNLYQFGNLLPERYLGKWAYYRIKQVDVNGNFSFSDTRAVPLPSSVLNDRPSWRFSPENRELIVGYYGTEAGKAELTVMDMQGRLLYRAEVAVQPGYQEFSVPAGTQMSPGFYHVRIQSIDGVDTFKVGKM